MASFTNYICYHKGRNFQFCVQHCLNSDLLPGQLSSNSVFIGKQNPELCQLSFICFYLQHLTLAPNLPSHDTTAAPQGLPLCTNPARILMSLLFYLSPALALWFFPNHHECEHSDLVVDGRLLRTFRNIHVMAHQCLWGFDQSGSLTETLWSHFLNCCLKCTAFQCKTCVLFTKYPQFS